MLCCEKDGEPLPITFRNTTLRPTSLGKRETRKAEAEIMTPQPDSRFYLQDIAR